MTRETRIGLLVGLGFIIMFSLILGELTGSSSSARPREHPRTQLSEISAPDFLPIIEPPEVAAIERVSPADWEGGAAAGEQASAAPRGVVRSTLMGPVDPDPANSTGAQMYAQRPSSAPPAAPRETTRPARRTYTVRANDSLRKIARKFYGPGGQHRYRKIFEANRNILDDESTIVIGQTLVIPSVRELDRQTGGDWGGAGPIESALLASTVRNPREVREMDLRQLREHFSSGPASPTDRPRSPARVYTVREGDNLTKIAKKVLRDGSHRTIMRIYNANRDKLTDPDVLTVGAKLRIPG